MRILHGSNGPPSASLGALTASIRRLALVGLAKNTGKTVALSALLGELQAQGRHVGVTSVGRDGEERDAIDAHIEKPRVWLAAGSLVASTDALLRASAIPYESLEQTGIRTPLGQVMIVRLCDAGAVEVAGPSAAADVRAVSDAMLAHGAQQVLIDGAIDRRAASSPGVADGLVMSTGAVLGQHISEVVKQTRDAVELVRLAPVESSSGGRLRALAEQAVERGATGADGLLVDEDFEPVALPPRFALTAEGEQIARLLDSRPNARWLILAGALPDRFLRHVLQAAHRRRRELVLVVADPTRVFLSNRGPAWYRSQGIDIQALRTMELAAITVNPLAPRSHRFDSAELRALLADAIPDVQIFDVLHADYLAAAV
ncbi:MAG TPA: hypothetical protein VGX72_09490 [Solirubrobacteraceae bacterium]|nr:hypothetical protein [Solirubrobacteraceae bacterium]